MAAGIVGTAGSGRTAPGDQRSLGRAYVMRKGPLSLGGSSLPDEAAWLKYLADVGRGQDPPPRASGFRNVQRR